jgi:hypothetical protein
MDGSTKAVKTPLGPQDIHDLGEMVKTSKIIGFSPSWRE